MQGKSHDSKVYLNICARFVGKIAGFVRGIGQT